MHFPSATRKEDVIKMRKQVPEQILLQKLKTIVALKIVKKYVKLQIQY